MFKMRNSSLDVVLLEKHTYFLFSLMNSCDFVAAMSLADTQDITMALEGKI